MEESDRNMEPGMDQTGSDHFFLYKAMKPSLQVPGESSKKVYQ